MRFVITTLLSLAVACQAAPRPVIESAAPPTFPASTPTSTQAPTPTAVRTPPNLPAPYQSPYLNPLDTVHTYVDDTCEYLRNRWDAQKAAPGTVVMAIMLHSINRRKGEGPEAMTAALFGRMMEELHRQRFQAINVQEFAAFVEGNARIPDRSALLIQDGRRYPENFSTHFRPYWEQWGWPVVNAWDHQGSTAEGLWAEYAALEQEGSVDFQVYGPTFNPGTKGTTDEYLTTQLQQPIKELQERFEKTPIAVIWPSGFSGQAAQIARQLGYRVGFTYNPRGPIMYNWVPLSDSLDTSRPSFLPEGSVADPLMTLPRYWAYQVREALDSVRIVGRQSAALAERNKQLELEYYDVVCAAKYGPIPN